MLAESALGELSAVVEEDDQDQEEDEGQQLDAQGYGGRGVYPPPTQDYETETEDEYDQGQDQQPHIAVHEATIEYTQPSIHPTGGVQRTDSQTTVKPLPQQQRARAGSNASTARTSSRMSMRAPSPRFGPGLGPLRPQSRLSVIRSDGQVEQDDASSTSSLGRPLSRASRNFQNVSPFNGSLSTSN